MEQQELIIKEIRKGNRFVVECDNLNHEGQGVSRINGLKDGELFENFPLFIDNFLPSEKGIVEITKLAKTYGYAKVTTLFRETKLEDHIMPSCPNYGICGGCNIMHMSYPMQLRFKKQMLEETLKKIGNIDDTEVMPVLGMKSRMAYRNKVQVPFRKKGFKTISGFFKRDSHEIVPFDTCVIQSEISTKIVNFVRNLCNEFRLIGYNELDNTGLIRHVLVRTNFNLSQIMVVLVLTSPNLPHQDEIVTKIINRYPVVKSILINVNYKPGNTILGDECITIYGNNTITDELCGLKFNIGAKSFYQVNPIQTEVLYNKAIELASLKPTDILVDAYCGIGTIGLIASSKVKEVYSVEIVEEAIQNAKNNAKLNKIKNIHFVCGKAELQIKKWLESGIQPDVIVVDPPRKGCDKTLLDTIDEMKISRVVYISCEPSTLARDLRILKEKGYHISKIQPVDMFPETSNVETAVLLCKKEPV